jgi:hypothetical protein
MVQSKHGVLAPSVATSDCSIAPLERVPRRIRTIAFGDGFGLSRDGAQQQLTVGYCLLPAAALPKRALLCLGAESTSRLIQKALQAENYSPYMPCSAYLLTLSASIWESS